VEEFASVERALAVKEAKASRSTAEHAEVGKSAGALFGGPARSAPNRFP